MAFLATRFTPRHRNLGRRRRRVRAEEFAPDLATDPFLADNMEPEPVCVAYWRRIWVAAPAAPQQTATCVLRRLNTEICPAKGPVAVGAGVLSLVGARLPGSHSGGAPGAGCRSSGGSGGPGVRCRAPGPSPARLPGCSVSAVGSPASFGARPAGRCSASRLRGPGQCAGWLPPVALAVVFYRLLFPALPLNSPAHRSRRQPQHHLATSSHSLSPERKTTLETPADPLPPFPVPRRESRVAPVAGHPGGPCLPG